MLIRPMQQLAVAGQVLRQVRYQFTDPEDMQGLAGLRRKAETLGASADCFSSHLKSLHGSAPKSCRKNCRLPNGSVILDILIGAPVAS